MESFVTHWKSKGGQWLKHAQKGVGRHLKHPVIRRLFARKDNRLSLASQGLHEKMPELMSLANELEDRFMTVGNGLESESEAARKLVAQSETLMGYVTGDNGGESCVKETVDMLEIPFTYVEDCLKRSNQILTRIRHHEQQLDSIRGLEVTLQNTIAPLKFIQTLYKVESATLSEEVQNVFSGLTKDIESLHVRVADTFNTHFRTLEKSHDTILELIDKLQRHIAIQTRKMKAKKDQIRVSIDQLREEIVANKNRDVVLSSASRSIFEQCGRVVVAMQYQDITRQKLQHIEIAVNEINSRAAAIAKPGVKEEGEFCQHECHYIKEASSLQATHLLTIIEDITKAELEITQGLGELKSRTNVLDRECLRLQSFKTISASADGMVQTLLDIIEEVRSLVGDTIAMQTEIYDTVRPLGGMASNLTETTRQLSTSIKLIALNAQVQAAQIGLGTGLEALAEGTCRISDETFEFNESTAADLDAFIWGLENIIDECGEICGQGDQQREYLSLEGSQMITKLHGYRDETLGAMLAVGDTAEKIETKLSELMGMLSFSRVAETHVQNLFIPLQELFESADEILTKAPDLQTGKVVSHLKVNYTMASERAVHHAMEKGAAGALVDAHAASSGFDAFVDLPDTHATSVPATAASRSSTTSAAPLETTTESPASPPEAEKPAAPKQDLGDNTELF